MPTILASNLSFGPEEVQSLRLTNVDGDWCVCVIISVERDPERAGEASEAVRDAQHRPTATCRRAEQRAAGGARRRPANAS